MGSNLNNVYGNRYGNSNGNGKGGGALIAVVILLTLVGGFFLWYFLYGSTGTKSKRHYHESESTRLARKCGKLPKHGIAWNDNCTVDCDRCYVHNKTNRTCDLDTSQKKCKP
jgi:hypothetical protein